MLSKLVALVSALLMGACSVIGIREVEEPSYRVVATLGPVEIRSYGPRIAAETLIAGDALTARNQGFRKIASYIFGANHGSAKIAMTAPVVQAPTEKGREIAMTAPVAQDQDSSGRWRIRFFMPSSYSLASLPTPDDPDVKIVTVPPEMMAVLRFTGDRDMPAIDAHGKQLLASLNGTGWQASGPVLAWFYDPPWTIPFLRRNEVAVLVYEERPS